MQHLVSSYGYAAIFLLAMCESMCVPIPSELLFAFAGALCAGVISTSTHLSVVEVIAVGLVGELVGASIAYVVGRTLGRTIVDRWGKWLLLTHKDLDRAEAFFERFGVFSIIIARIVPILRSVVSLPAGVAEMKVPRFLALTAVGSVVWISILVGLGDAAGASWHHVERDFHFAEYPALAVIVVALVYGFWHRWRAVHHAAADGAQP